MRLTESYFLPTITNEGVEELYCYVDSILHKSGNTIPQNQWEDVKQEMILRCLEKLPSYDPSNGTPLGGYLYWQCRGAISIWANHHNRELAMAADKLAVLKALERRRDGRGPW